MPLNAIGLFAATVETVLLIWLSADRHGVADRAIHEHRSGWLIRIAGILTGPFPLVLRFFGSIPSAAISFLLGALVSRFGWIVVGKISGRDPESVFASQKCRHPSCLSAEQRPLLQRFDRLEARPPSQAGCLYFAKITRSICV